MTGALEILSGVEMHTDVKADIHASRGNRSSAGDGPLFIWDRSRIDTRLPICSVFCRNRSYTLICSAAFASLIRSSLRHDSYLPAVMENTGSNNAAVATQKSRLVFPVGELELLHTDYSAR